MVRAGFVAMSRYFSSNHIQVLNEAVAISEEVTNDFFPLTRRDWIENPYEVRTLHNIEGHEHPGDSFAHLVRYSCDPTGKLCGRDAGRLYRICLNDPRFLEEIGSMGQRALGALMVYVITHELVHIVRFGRYLCLPSLEDRRREEERVHGLTQEILAPIRIECMPQVLDRFDRLSGEI